METRAVTPESHSGRLGGFCKPETQVHVGSNPTSGSVRYKERMQPVNPKWLESGLVLVCERCFKERIPEEAPEVAERIGDFNLRDWLKSKLKENDEWGPIRVIATTCMDVCAKGKVTVCLDSKNGDPANVFVVDPIAERSNLYDFIVESMGKKTRSQ